MSASVQTLIKSTPAKPSAGPSASKSAKALFEGEPFRVELGKASQRAHEKPAEEPQPAKPTKSAGSKKADTKDEPSEVEATADAEDQTSNDAQPAAAAADAEPTEGDDAAVEDAAPDVDAPQDTAADSTDAPALEATFAAELAMITPTPQTPPTVQATTSLDTADAESTAATPAQSVTFKTSETSVTGVPNSPVDSEAFPAERGVAPAAAKPQHASTAQDHEVTGEVAVAELVKDMTPESEHVVKAESPGIDQPFATQIDQQTKELSATATQAAKTEAPPAPPEVRFAEANHNDIVKSISTELLPRGGTMKIRLDPPELGALQVTLSIKEGIVSASFQTSNDEATKLLSHSLSQLKAQLETTGVTVDKLQVQQTPRDNQTKSNDDPHQRNQPGQDDMARQQEQQRKEMLKRMWRKLTTGSDPLDMMA